MNDFPPRENEQVERYRKLVLELVEDISRDIERTRNSALPLESAEIMAWRRLELTAHNISARAEALRLQVLQHAAGELELLAGRVLREAEPQNCRSIQAALVAVEALAIEVEALRREYSLVSR